MSEDTPTKTSSLRPAFWLALAIFASLLALVPLLAHDQAARHQLETTSETTAVGDQALLKHRTRGPAPALSYHGRPLVIHSPRHIEARDSKMTFAGMEDGGTLRLYTTTEPVPWEKGEAELKGQPVYYLKVDVNEYLRVQ